MSGAYLIRPLTPDDMGDVYALRDLAGPGFTSLAVSDAALAARVAASFAAFSATDPAANAKARYMLGLEHLESGRLVGLAGVKSQVGADQPFFNFRRLRIAQASRAAQRRFDLDVLVLVNELTGASEVGTLFVHPQHRAGGVGRALAQARYLLMAAHPDRFAETVVAELRGMVDADGRAPFWEHVGRHFFRMDFAEADRLSAETDNQFILDLMPKHPIYVDLLAPEAQAVIGHTHPEGAPARKLLEWEGFRFAELIDIFDGGPLMMGAREGLKTVREAQHLKLQPPLADGARRRALISAGAGAAFRAAPALGVLTDLGLHCPEPLYSLLGAAGSGETLSWIGDAV